MYNFDCCTKIKIIIQSDKWIFREDVLIPLSHSDYQVFNIKIEIRGLNSGSYLFIYFEFVSIEYMNQAHIIWY